MKKSKTVKVDLADGKSVNIKCIPVNSEIRMESQRYYSKAFAFALENDFPLKAEYERVLRKKGLFNLDEEEKQVEKIRKDIKDLEVRLWSARRPDGTKMTKEEGKQLALEIKDKRDSMNDVVGSISDIFANTAEHYASNEQLQYLLFASTINTDTGERYWANFDLYKSDTENGDNPVLKEAMSLFVEVSAGKEDDYRKKLPENSWLIKMGFMNEKIQFIDTKGRLVDRNGKLINSDGRYITESGEFVDEFGNKVDKEGNAIYEDGWQE